jgi:putative sterol carrier protein
VLTADLGTFLSLGAGQLALDEAVASGEIRVDGDPNAGRRLMEICDLVPAPAT